jgi:hypothetical protein
MEQKCYITTVISENKKRIIMKKNTRYHFDNKIVESWGISLKNQTVKHNICKKK